MAEHFDEEDIVIDGSLARDIVRRHVWGWLIGGLIVLAVLVGCGLMWYPQTFTSTVSLAVQQPSPVSSPLALLAGGGASKRYLGILTSRRAAEAVEKQAHVQQLYGLDTHDKALKMLQTAVHPRDSAADGLLYVDVELPGPSFLRGDSGGFRTKVRDATAVAANAYAGALKKYYVTDDNDRDTVLLREAEKARRTAREAFDRSTERMFAFIRGLNKVDPKALPTVGTQGSGAGAGLGELPSLYTSLATVEASIRAAEAGQSARSALTNRLLSDPSALPSEDPLLTRMRREVADARQDLANLRIQLGDGHPKVVEARQRVRIAEADLDRQVRGVRQQHTTEHVQSESELESLRAKRDKLIQQITDSEGKLREKQELSAEYEMVRDEVGIRLDALKATEAKAAELKLSTASAASRISVIDEALPPKTGSPGPIRITAISLLLVLLALGGWAVVEYVAESGRRQRATYGRAVGVEGVDGLGAPDRVVIEEATK